MFNGKTWFLAQFDSKKCHQSSENVDILGGTPPQLPLQLKLYALVDLHEGPGIESSIP